MPILLMVNLKDGVTKTTNTVAVAKCFAKSGLPTLIVDADRQCMAGELLLGENHRAERAGSTHQKRHGNRRRTLGTG
jgi:cellulose biosynthesis protein BcsQ